MIPQKQRRYHRTLEETLEAWQLLTALNTPLTKKQLMDLRERESRYFNADGSLKREPTDEELREYERAQEVSYLKCIRINRADMDNVDKGVINQKRIKQLENFMRFNSQPRSKQDRWELHCLLMYGKIYPYQERWKFRIDRRRFL